MHHGKVVPKQLLLFPMGLGRLPEISLVMVQLFPYPVFPYSSSLILFRSRQAQTGTEKPYVGLSGMGVSIPFLPFS